MFRVADLGTEGRELVKGLGSGRLAHPCQRRDGLAVCRQQVGNEVVHPLFGCWREVPGDIELADGLTQGRFDEGDAALPASFERRGAVEDATVKVEVLIDEG